MDQNRWFRGETDISWQAPPQTLRRWWEDIRQGIRAQGGRAALLCRRGEQQGRLGAAAHHHPCAGCALRACLSRAWTGLPRRRALALQDADAKSDADGDSDGDALASSKPTRARPCTHTAKPPPPPPKSPSPPGQPPSSVRAHDPSPVSAPPVRPGHLHAHRVPHIQRLCRRERGLAQRRVILPQFYIRGSGLPRGGGKCGTPRDGSTHHHRCMARFGRDAPARRCYLHAARLAVRHCQEKWDRGPRRWSSVRSAHACGKTLSTSALVDAPATPPALGTCVRGGEREKDAVEQRAQPAAIPVLWHGVRARVPAHTCTLTRSHRERVSESSRHQRGHTRQRDANGGPYMQSNFGTPFPESL
ncbi:hypothetical protein B0H14DRAFT_2621681 [Mycena olivaceomarginata]|nr:hypothetical protein B0H14DRAFT_2621681 [Mycena olivaceomarginata]